VSIAAVNNNVCAGTPITFNATVTNVGSAYAFTWLRNGVNLFLNSPTYTVTSPNNGDFIMCAVQTFYACVTTSVAVSNEVTINITPPVTPTINIMPSAPSVCKGSTASFTATTTYEGPSPVYQWRKNGVPVGNNNAVYTDNAIAQGDVVDCILTSNANCLATPTASSNAISLTVYENPVVTIGHTNSLCTSSPTSLDPGNYASYLWDDGSTDRIRNINSPGTYHVEVTDHNGCKGTGTTTITTVFTSPSGFAPSDTAICSYGSVDLKAKTGYASYLWSTGATSSTITVTAPDTYWVEVKAQNGCTAKESLTVSPKDCMKGVYIPSAFTPNNDGRNDVFKPLVYGNVKHYKFQVFNRWGEIVFQSDNPANGWDGTNKGVKLETNVFVWVCSYQLEGEEKKTERGTVVVIR
jgi:gliding motility-associated-like protein